MYRKLDIWQSSIKLIKMVYDLSEQLPKTEEYNLKIQLKRAVTSVNLNIAEGKSRKSGKDFAHFLSIASGLLTEVKAIIDICVELQFLSSQDELEEYILQLNKQINSLRTHVLRKSHNE